MRTDKKRGREVERQGRGERRWDGRTLGHFCTPSRHFVVFRSGANRVSRLYIIIIEEFHFKYWIIFTSVSSKLNEA